MASSEDSHDLGDQGGLSGFSPEELARLAQLRDEYALQKDNSTIPFTPEQINTIVGLFSKNRYGETLRKYLKPEWRTRCQRDLFSCSSLAIAAVDLRDAALEDKTSGKEPGGFPARSLLVCRDHVQTAWTILEKELLMDRSVSDVTLPAPSVGINGFTEKELREMYPAKS